MSVLKFVSFDPLHPFRVTTISQENVRTERMLMALEQISSQQLLSQTIFNALVIHPNPVKLADAILSMYKSGLIDNTYIFNMALTHPHPVKFVEAMTALTHRQFIINKMITDAFASNLEPMDMVHTLEILDQLKLMKQDYVELAAKHPNPLDAAKALMVLHIYHLLDEDNARLMLKCPQPKALTDALKFMHDHDMLHKYPEHIMQSIFIHPNPGALVRALLKLREASSSFEQQQPGKNDSILRKSFDLLISHHTQPAIFANLLIYMHHNKLDTQPNIAFIDKLFHLCESIGPILLDPQQESLLKDILAHQDRDNLLKVLVVLAKSRLVTADNIQVLLDDKHPELLSINAFVRNWQPMSGKLSQELFKEITDTIIHSPQPASRHRRSHSGLFNYPETSDTKTAAKGPTRPNNKK